MVTRRLRGMLVVTVLGVLLVGTMVMLVSLLVDITYGIINPRIRHQR